MLFYFRVRFFNYITFLHFHRQILNHLTPIPILIIPQSISPTSLLVKIPTHIRIHILAVGDQNTGGHRPTHSDWLIPSIQSIHLPKLFNCRRLLVSVDQCNILDFLLLFLDLEYEFLIFFKKFSKKGGLVKELKRSFTCFRRFFVWGVARFPLRSVINYWLEPTTGSLFPLPPPPRTPNRQSCPSTLGPLPHARISSHSAGHSSDWAPSTTIELIYCSCL
jgi:hypothetical protein